LREISHGIRTSCLWRTADLLKNQQFATVGMGLRPTHAGMKMSSDAVVAPERAKVATVNGTLSSSHSLTAEAWLYPALLPRARRTD